MQEMIYADLTEIPDDSNEHQTCHCCGHVYHIDEIYYIGNESICSGCFDEYAAICSRCHTFIWNADNQGDYNTPLCQSCYDSHYSTCSSCSSIIPQNDIYYNDDNDMPYCSSCYDRYCSCPDSIQDYNYKPEPIFHGGGGRYLGVELEIDDGGKNEDNARQILETANCIDEHIYIKSDSSLNDGLEIVTHPCSLEYHIKHLPWAEISSLAINLGYSSHMTDTCGLHVHVNRNAFSDNLLDQEACIGRILYFIEKHWEELLKFSRRTESQIKHWASRYGYKPSPKDILKHAKSERCNRYSCLNLTNHSTIEFRIFRGTLKYNTLIATLQMVDRICSAAISMSDSELSSLSWTSFVAGVNESELTAYLKERRLYVNEPVEITEEEL